MNSILCRAAVPAVLAATLAAGLAPSPAQAGLERMRDGLKAELAIMLPGDPVDVDLLSDAQVAQINHLIHSDRGTGDIIGLVRGTLGDCLPLLCQFTTRR
ncbi:hypothetical protein BV394_10645 [Brevirhabdus pacifica]|uniref:Uncharacterized protein n=1 Tax=Brevirhabdus pacifica TaxID=1267768 RepID=A0A1U7DJG3_9RHOB|nr:hypothetical protein [Brevirhabdus pacifica]APX90122.1 hypothetical protein BV394_10645 [Brevirhabdus pacifica]OWU74085.1 hypothetical protein ATO5_15615 [Loktanella sp. 22II-4b]PJJ80546.1 hypothetical protein CLV77_2815 [Brevirhabdus pacifica]